MLPRIPQYMNPNSILAIKSQDQHEAALRCLEALMLNDPPAGAVEDEEIARLASLIEAYEKRTIRLSVGSEDGRF